MSLKVLIVDDSAMSRKINRRALPQEWDVSISEAANGREALEAYRAGKAELMFLDLTMPEMDGFEVLATLQREGLDCFVIVISADVQPQAQERAKKLGAMAFIKKPVDPREVARILREYGIFDDRDLSPSSDSTQGDSRTGNKSSKQSKDPASFTEEQQDALREMTNVAMGQAGASLAAMLDHYVNLSTPTTRVVSSQQLADAVQAMLAEPQEPVAAVRQAFYSQVRGEAIIIYDQKGCRSLADLLGHEGEIGRATERELLLDVANLLVGAVINGLGEQIGESFNLSAPAMMARSMPVEKLLHGDRMEWHHALLVEVHFGLEQRDFQCHMVILMPEESILGIRKFLENLLEGMA
ncbi:response regulator [Gammaproteobacteria bacterium AB-CW1]|uniref:Response regulator n=1 Tax=Natronospira elongata TaxID=3110268 RepID=A0AAP6JGB6_9GAMM|nr:response regulator [Gammaproteobacteria bacterium AB-CW1]